MWGEDASWWDEVDPEDLVLGPVAWLEHLEPSARLMGELEGLPADLVDSDLDAVEMVAHWSRLEAHCAERKRRAAAAVARRTSMAEGLARLGGLGVRSHEANIAGDELSIRLGIGPIAARALIRSGRAFDGIAFPTGDALAAGVIDARKADLIVTGVEDLPVDAALEVQEKVLSKAAHLPTGRLRRELAKARAAVDPEHFEQRCQAAVAARRVDEPRVLADGMASIYAVLPAVGAIQLYRAVDAAARSAKTSGDERTLDQLRADALVLMGETAVQTGWIGPAPGHATTGCSAPEPDVGHPPRDASAAEDAMREGGSAEGAMRIDGPPLPDASVPPGGDRDAGPGGEVGACCPGGDGVVGESGAGSGMRIGVLGGRSAHVRVVVPLTSLMGGSAGPGADLPGSDAPAELEGYGPIPASVARALAAGGPWARMVTDPVDRTVLELSREQYEPTQAMADLVRAREPECVHPICGVSSDRCDLHHRIPWPIGITSVRCLDPGCRRHHVLITHAGWDYRTDEHGRRVWTTPTGLRYIEEPDGSITLRRPGHLPPPPRARAGGARADDAEGFQAAPTSWPHDDAPPPF